MGGGAEEDIACCQRRTISRSQPAAGLFLFCPVSQKSCQELLPRDRIKRADFFATAAIDAEVGVDDARLLLITDRCEGADLDAGRAGHTIIFDIMGSHNDLLYKRIVKGF